MTGRPGRSGGQNRLSLEAHVLRGTFNPTRHGHLIDPGPAWDPAPALLEALGAAGRAFVARPAGGLRPLSALEGELALEGAHAVDRLAELRRPTARRHRERPARLGPKLELAWQKALSVCLLALRARMDRRPAAATAAGQQVGRPVVTARRRLVRDARSRPRAQSAADQSAHAHERARSRGSRSACAAGRNARSSGRCSRPIPRPACGSTGLPADDAAQERQDRAVRGAGDRWPAVRRRDGRRSLLGRGRQGAGGALLQRRRADDPQRSRARRPRARSSTRRSASCIASRAASTARSSAEAYTKHGFNASRVIYDELHAAPTRELWDVLASSTGARAQPLVIAISTAGYDRHSILWELYQHAKRVQADAGDRSDVPAGDLRGADRRRLDRRARVARRRIPRSAISARSRRCASPVARAQEIPAQETAFRRLYLNQWTEQDVRWIALAAWDACQAPIDPRGARRPALLCRPGPVHDDRSDGRGRRVSRRRRRRVHGRCRSSSARPSGFRRA